MFELLQYKPATDTVLSTPLLIVPPMINKFYAIDLAPGRSMVEFLVQQGVQVFLVSWRNPDARHRDWGMDPYAQASWTLSTRVGRITGRRAGRALRRLLRRHRRRHDGGPPAGHR